MRSDRHEQWQYLVYRIEGCRRLVRPLRIPSHREDFRVPACSFRLRVSPSRDHDMIPSASLWLGNRRPGRDYLSETGPFHLWPLSRRPGLVSALPGLQAFSVLTRQGAVSPLLHTQFRLDNQTFPCKASHICQCDPLIAFGSLARIQTLSKGSG